EALPGRLNADPLENTKREDWRSRLDDLPPYPVDFLRQIDLQVSGLGFLAELQVVGAADTDRPRIRFGGEQQGDGRPVSRNTRTGTSEPRPPFVLRLERTLGFDLAREFSVLEHHQLEESVPVFIQHRQRMASDQRFQVIQLELMRSKNNLSILLLDGNHSRFRDRVLVRFLPLE